MSGREYSPAGKRGISLPHPACLWLGIGYLRPLSYLFLVPALARVLADRMRLGDNKCGPCWVIGSIGIFARSACRAGFRPPSAPQRTRQPRVRPRRRSEVRAREPSREALRPRAFCPVIVAPEIFMLALIALGENTDKPSPIFLPSARHAPAPASALRQPIPRKRRKSRRKRRRMP